MVFYCLNIIYSLVVSIDIPKKPCYVDASACIHMLDFVVLNLKFSNEYRINLNDGEGRFPHNYPFPLSYPLLLHKMQKRAHVSPK